MSQASRILLSLVLGLLAGVTLSAFAPSFAGQAVLVAEPIGTAWLSGLQMTVIPLVVALIVTGVAQTAEAASAGKVAGRAIALFVTAVFVTGTIAALVTPLILQVAPVPTAAAASLRAALSGATPVAAPPPLAEFFTSLIPTNVVAAAANNAFLSLIFFTLAFAFAVTRIEPEARARLTGLFAAVRDAMLVLVRWVLLLAPIGVFALALVVGGRAGGAAFGALVHYMVVVASVGVVIIALSYLLALAAGVGPFRFGKAIGPAQAVAASTQSSLATLPAMLTAAERLAVPTRVSGVTLPVGVAMFRATQPAMNVAIAVYIAAWFGVALEPANLVAAVAIGAIVSLGSVSLPAQITFYASVAPVCVALGVPVAPLGLLIAVETIPDIFRTVGNVSMNLAATTLLSRWSRTDEDVEATVA